MQVHVIWHPASDEKCRPLAGKIYTTFNRDAYQPLFPGIGIPVFFRCAGGKPDDPRSTPAQIATPDTECDLRIVLLTSDFVFDAGWKSFWENSVHEVRAKGNKGAILAFGLSPGMAEGDAKVVQLDTFGEQAADVLIQHVLLQACRLLGGRPRVGSSPERGAAPMKLFLSHTKRDTNGLVAAKALKGYFDNLEVDRFFDEVSIQPGDSITQELIEEIKDSAFVAVRTDGYLASPWCRKELALAKRAQRPIVVMDALTGIEARSSPFMAYLPSIRMDPPSTQMDQQQARAILTNITNFIGLEVLRFLHAERQLKLLKAQGMFPADAVLLLRPPEARDLVAAVHDGGATANKARVVFVHPDPVLAAEETEDLSLYPATLVTPITAWSKRLDGMRLGLSTAPVEAAELAALGISELHVKDAVRIVARQALAAGATLVYGGALELRTPAEKNPVENFTETLFQMIGAYNKGGLIQFPPLIDYSPWPWSQEVDIDWLAARRSMLDARLCEPPEDAREFSAGDGPGHVERLKKTVEGRYALARSLYSMRQLITGNTHARIVLGGKLRGFSGLLPGIVEETLLSIRRNQPIYIVGGFGGAARVVALAVYGQKPSYLSREYQNHTSSDYTATLSFYEKRKSESPGLNLADTDYSSARRELEAYGVRGLAAKNGLTEAENLELFSTGSIDVALFLIMKGLSIFASSAS
jgi:hypothetical protein